MKKKDITGQRVGMLTAIRTISKNKAGSFLWSCQCDCGNEYVTTSTELLRRRSKVRNCGCRTGRFIHGMAGTPEYSVWKGMRARCRDPRHVEYHLYGGRGIKVCERWNSFSNFISDMGVRPSHSHQIDRIENDGNYEPSNCRWVTRREQLANSRVIHRVDFRGEQIGLAELWRRINGAVPYQTIVGRINSGWSVERAIIP